MRAGPRTLFVTRPSLASDAATTARRRFYGERLEFGAQVIPENVVPTIAGAALVIALLSLLIALWSVLRLRRLARRSGQEGSTVGAVASEAERIDRLARELAATATRLDAAEAQGQRSIQRIGVVRYNPFADTGSNQSFVLAMLDARGDGFVLSSLHSRQQTRIFLKPVSGGRSETAISEEEAEAIRLAGIK